MPTFDWFKTADPFRLKNKGKAASSADEDDDDDDLPKPTAVATPTGAWLPSFFKPRGGFQPQPC